MPLHDPNRTLGRQSPRSAETGSNAKLGRRPCVAKSSEATHKSAGQSSRSITRPAAPLIALPHISQSRSGGFKNTSYFLRVSLVHVDAQVPSHVMRWPPLIVGPNEHGYAVDSGHPQTLRTPQDPRYGSTITVAAAVGRIPGNDTSISFDVNMSVCRRYNSRRDRQAYDDGSTAGLPKWSTEDALHIVPPQHPIKIRTA
jgi:hypothetical protein